jgi:hypothetical protein
MMGWEGAAVASPAVEYLFWVMCAVLPVLIFGYINFDPFD